MDHFAGGGGEPVGEKSDDGFPGWFGVGLVPPEWRAVAPHVFEGFEAGDGLGGGGLEWSGGYQVDADLVWPHVLGEVARGRFHGCLCHAHPVICRPCDGCVEGEAYDSGAGVEHALCGDGD